MTTCAVVSATAADPHTGPFLNALQAAALPVVPSPVVCLQPQVMARNLDEGLANTHIVSGWTQSGETVACSSQLVTEQQPSTCEEEDGSAYVEQHQRQQQHRQQNCDAGQPALGERTPNFPTHDAVSDQPTPHPALATLCSSTHHGLQDDGCKHPNEAQPSQLTMCTTMPQSLAHERLHTVQRLSNNRETVPLSALMQPAVQAVPRSQALQSNATLQHNAAPLTSASFLHRPLARRVVKRQIQRPGQHENLQHSQQPTQTEMSGAGEHESLVSVPTMIYYPLPHSLQPPRSFVKLVSDSPLEQMGVDSQRQIPGACAPQAMAITKSARAKKPKKRLSTKRQSSCC